MDPPCPVMVAFTYSPSQLPGSPSASTLGTRPPPAALTPGGLQAPTPAQAPSDRPGPANCPSWAVSWGPREGEGPKAQSRAGEKPEVSEAPGSPRFLTAAGPWLTHSWSRAGGAGSRPSWAWGVRPLEAPRFQRWAPLHGDWCTLVRKPLKQSCRLRAAESSWAHLHRLHVSPGQRLQEPDVAGTRPCWAVPEHSGPLGTASRRRGD